MNLFDFIMIGSAAHYFNVIRSPDTHSEWLHLKQNTLPDQHINQYEFTTYITVYIL